VTAGFSTNPLAVRALRTVFIEDIKQYELNARSRLPSHFDDPVIEVGIGPGAQRKHVSLAEKRKGEAQRLNAGLSDRSSGL